jgi:hypothetical protein
MREETRVERHGWRDKGGETRAERQGSGGSREAGKAEEVRRNGLHLVVAVLERQAGK